ncbi:MAG: LPS assembly lipoprotein LptE [Betaproteobacteria bacterium]
MSWSERRRALLALGMVAVTASCGFQLRGRVDLPFERIYVEGMEYSPFTAQLRRAIETGSATKLADNAKDAQATLTLLGESQERVILALSGGGRVREFQLRYRVSFQVNDGKGKTWLPADEVVLVRDLTYDDTQVLAKEAEAQLLFKDMQNDAVIQVLRRIQAIRASSTLDS